MWINDKIIYTPEVMTVTKGEPVEAHIRGVHAVTGALTIELSNGKRINVEPGHCKKAHV